MAFNKDMELSHYYHLHCTITGGSFDHSVSSLPSSSPGRVEWQEGEAKTPEGHKVRHTHLIPERGWIPGQSKTEQSPLRFPNPYLATAGTTPSLIQGLVCIRDQLLLPRKPALRLQRPWSGEGDITGWEKQRPNPFLDHVAATSSQSAEVGVHPEDPAGAAGKWRGAYCSRVSLCPRASFRLLSQDRRTGSEATSCGHDGRDLVVWLPPVPAVSH